MSKIYNFLLFAATILIMNLLTGYITDAFLNHKNFSNPYKFTALGMLILVAFFYPFFEIINKKIQILISKMLKKGRHYFGKTVGVLAIFCLLFALLYCIYANLWFNINIPKVLLFKIIY
jgi:hypothetical protein